MTDTANPEQTALLVMGYQAGIVGNIADADALVPRMADTIAVARDRGAHIGYVRVAFADEDYAAVPATNKLFSRLAEGRPMHADDPATQVHPDLAPRPEDIVVRKTRVGAFSTTDLARRLADRDVTTLVLAGIATSGVVLSTLRDAADHDYRLFVLADRCADGDAEVHDVLTRKVFPRQVDVITSADLPALLG
ncbi:MAG: isochorismatase family protein [Actinophytocola sp.]|uniref:cysteine hydrolase family protein n=1 Tax=Actinophytocola sp. TaxID=1872138 RepID=UPI001322C41C|nr:isochorismatase family cysteine hydrolase [Actinophytocola sp.]MPZ83778.1 isochorismatase family protein [Actinophytocola sp.]